MDDLIVVDFTFGGFVFKPDPPRLERAANEAFVVAEFPPQSFGEEAYLAVAGQTFTPETNEQVEVTSHPRYPPKNVQATSDEAPTTLGATRIRMSGPSRIAVSMPQGVDVIGFDGESLLTALRDWPMRLDVNARPESPGFLLREPIGRVPITLPQDGAPGTSISNAPLDAGVTSAAAAASSSTGIVESIGLATDIDLTAILDRIGPHEPSPTVTALELPYRLLISPVGSARWRHAHEPVERHGRTELWHTRLSTSDVASGADGASRIRALWSPDYRPQARLGEVIALLTTPGPGPGDQPEPNPHLIRMSLDPVDRAMLVTLMSGFDAERTNGSPFIPRTSEATRLHLSALGALLDAEGTWRTTPRDIDLEQWRHLATLGRDHYVRVMYKGYLYPFGHAASLIKVTERGFEPLAHTRGTRVAFLRQRFFVAVREPVRVYTGAGHVHSGRSFPFSRIELLTRVTPDLSEPGMGASALQPAAGIVKLYAGLAPRMLFWPMVPAGGTPTTDVRFEIAATDLEGRLLTFAMPLLFVGAVANDNKAADVKTSYNAAAAGAKRRAPLGGAVVAFAPASAGDTMEPRLPADSMTFRAGDLTASPKGAPNVHPEMDVASVGIAPIQKLLALPSFTAEVAYPDDYKTSGFNPSKNAGRVFLRLTKSRSLTFGTSGAEAKSDALGALASPQTHLLGLSTLAGPVSGSVASDATQVETALTTIRSGTFDPADYFRDATLLGGIKIGEVLTSVTDLRGSAVPKLVSQRFPDRVEARFDWSTEVTKSDTLKLLAPRADGSKPPTRLAMSGVVRTPTDPALPASFEATARMDNFKVNRFGFIILWFEEITFVARNGQKPDVTVQLREGEEAVQFGGPLEFVNDLRRFIPSNGFSDPPALNVTPTGISASYTLTLPAVQVGVFALTNAALGAAFQLPFDGRPASVRFSFSSREQPFSLTVSLLGGGGFLAVGVSARGVTEIEAALEFGAAISLDLGVASGSVEVKAGIYFHWLEVIPDKGSVELAGYVRIHGELTVIGIISVSLTFNLQLGYLKQPGSAVVYGEATLTVEIEILMFSAEVSVTCRREFAGGNADPRFIDLVPTAVVWADYCDCFAEEVA